MHEAWRAARAPTLNDAGEVAIGGGDGNANVWLPAARYNLPAGLNNLNSVLAQVGITNFITHSARKINQNHWIIGSGKSLVDNITHGYVLDLTTLSFTVLTATQGAGGINDNPYPQVAGGAWMYASIDGTETSLPPLITSGIPKGM